MISRVAEIIPEAFDDEREWNKRNKIPGSRDNLMKHTYKNNKKQNAEKSFADQCKRKSTLNKNGEGCIPFCMQMQSIHRLSLREPETEILDLWNVKVEVEGELYRNVA